MPAKKAPAATKKDDSAPRRKRRSPEEAQTLILDAAERLFAEHGPDRVSVLDVALAAGVSHSLVLHYFKTYAELVRSVLARRNRLVFQQVKQRILSDTATQAPPRPDELLGIVLSVVAEPAHARLLAWAALSGEAQHLKMVKNRGLAKIVDLAVARLAASRGQKTPAQAQTPSEIPRARIEEAVLIAIAAVHGYATGKSVYLPALGLAGSDTDAHGNAMDQRFQRALGAMLQAFVGAI
jgi:AcrR family transcriptional regulator